MVKKVKCSSPVYLKRHDMYVRCGNCLSCRIKKSLEWSMRISHELQQYKNVGSFLTLTYNNMNLPLCLGLCKRHLQLFFKRLRRDFEYKYKKNLDFKYFAVGEYGGLHGRPHYHIIFIGLPPEYFKEKSIYWQKVQKGYNFETSLWNKGICNIQIVAPPNIKYVTGYVMKKLGKGSAKEYIEYGFQPPFQVASKGIGLEWIQNNALRIDFKNSSLKYNGKKIGLPRYYRDKLEIDAQEVIPIYDAVLERVKYFNKYKSLSKGQIQELSNALTNEHISQYELSNILEHRHLEMLRKFNQSKKT